MRLGSANAQCLLVLQDLYRRGRREISIGQLEDYLLLLMYTSKPDRDIMAYEPVKAEHKYYEEEIGLGRLLVRCLKGYGASREMWEYSAGQIFNTLQRLEKKGFIDIKDVFEVLNIKKNTHFMGRFKKMHPVYQSMAICLNSKIEEYNVCDNCNRRLQCVIGGKNQ